MTRARTPGRRGKPWRKRRIIREQKDVQTAYRAAIENHGDAAALVQVVRDCQEAGKPVPAWVPEALEWLLTDFVNVVNGYPRKKWAKWAKWAKRWPREFVDGIVSRHMVEMRQSQGLGWKEAKDEAADRFDGTWAAGGPDAMGKAHTRHQARRTSHRTSTTWERAVAREAGFDLRPGRVGSWWHVNGQRYDWDREVWLKPPVLIRTRNRKE